MDLGRIKVEGRKLAAARIESRSEAWRFAVNSKVSTVGSRRRGQAILPLSLGGSVSREIP